MPNKSRWLQLINFIVPVAISIVNPALAPLGGLIVHGINEAEDLTNASGPEKLAHVVNLSLIGAESLNSAAGRTLVDPNQVQAVAGSVISTAVDVANLINNLPTSTRVQVPASKSVPTVPATPAVPSLAHTEAGTDAPAETIES